ncbi:MAG: hypothetical protein J0M05_02360 [Candidatus Kapabacteria bacterium]|jgi:hypothetical protein|nr:hypothetical protein [Candidatus Kapabacteria bacterium]
MTYLQTFEIKTENRKAIILTDPEFYRDKSDKIYPLMGNVIVPNDLMTQ